MSTPHLVDSGFAPITELIAPDVLAIADKYGMRYAAPDEEGMSFEKSALLSFADELQTAAYAEGRKDEREEAAAAHARMDQVLRRIFYAAQWEQVCPGSFNFVECAQMIRDALTTDTKKEPTS